MSTDAIISVEGVSKKFCRSLKRTIFYGTRDISRDVFGRSQSLDLRPDEFWALNNVAFEVKPGECLGLIGPNGAGKSTLLKLLNGITHPDKGAIRVRGRIGALLELGAGFHPMLSGRENIYLSAAILGLTKDEIAKKFEAIVDFAGLEEFIDTPVKHYSSGMYVRLGFSVAISIDPEIMIIDESMAVGDAAFRKRCVETIEAFIKAGKTIIVVTHNLQEIEKIARRILLLDHGVIRADGCSAQVIATYMDLLNMRQRQEAWKDKATNGTQCKSTIEIVEFEVCGEDGKRKYYFQTHDELRVVIKFNAYRPIANPVFRVQIYRNDGLFCHGMNTERHGLNYGEISGEGKIILRYPDFNLLSGHYSIHVAVLLSQYDESPIHQLKTSIRIHVESNMADGAGVSAMPTEWIEQLNEKAESGTLSIGG